ncbi:aminopeptidase N [Scleromatobacter humisilvae]|uniref:Aminopeptidase N n=1 Tax=Scleromatobacter humisilvae TaxID=2897159 RepID=A0A9X1YE21_9BURK|nr:aminopeptidase N [Scleromatobacter humisilvae]MCK9684479.1 aminopeptidase N [Scleromatobacter humisilvae]
MREGSPALVRREDYTAPAWWVRSVDLTFDLDPAKTIVASKLAIERNTERPAEPLRLDGEGLNLLRVLVDGQSVSFRHEDGQLVIDAPAADAFVLEIRNTVCPEKNTELSGLYTSGGGFFTQCEAQGFRRITYFFDRPDVMAIYTVTLRADKAKYPVLLSNGNLAEQGSLDNGRHFARWNDPFPKPCYLFALVAADLVAREQRVTSRAGKDHLLQVFVRRGDLDKTEHAMNSLVASLVWDEARFKLPLDLERFMIVAVEDFNMGAMENKGLNLFNTKYVLASPATATDTDYSLIESVVGHEYFHNWTGNRITCRDWFQLSLKEGLTVFRDQEFSQDMAGSPSARGVKRIDDVRTLRQIQFPEDAGPMSHPVRPDSYVAIDNFYTATVYEKGSEVVRMMQTLVGRGGFERGITEYFRRHDGQAVTCDAFAQSIADVNPASPLNAQLEAFKRWYSQSGTPKVTARGTAADGTWTLTLAQDFGAPQGVTSPVERQPFVIPVRVALFTRDGRPVPLKLEGDAEAAPSERVLVLSQAEATYRFLDVPADVVPSVLRDFSAPVLLDDGLTDADRLVLLAHDTDPVNRWEAGQRLALSQLVAAITGDGTLALNDAYVDAMRAVLRDPSLDPAFKELVLTPPSEAYVSEQLTVPVDPQRVHAVCQQMQDQLAARLHDDWLAAWDANQISEGYSPDGAQSARRALANLALAMLVRDAARSGDSVWPGKAYQRFKDAGNMTDRLGALGALVGAHSELATPALARFHELFQNEALVVDKWFGLQARASEKDGRVFAKVKALLQHPDFSMHNPNRVRSLLLALCNGNPAAFHRPDAKGYVFWAEKVVELDAINPQVASRLARALDRWRNLAEPYRGAAREAIARVAAKTDLSPDVREVVDRALKD